MLLAFVAITGRGRWCSRSRLTVTHFGGAAAAFGKRVVVVAAPAVVALTAATAVALTVLPIVLVIWHASVVVESTAPSNSSHTSFLRVLKNKLVGQKLALGCHLGKLLGIQCPLLLQIYISILQRIAARQCRFVFVG